MMKHDKFAVFILSHGRADVQVTYKLLKARNYTGRIVVVCDNEDDQIELYKKNFPEVYIFDKLKVAQETDVCDLSTKRNAVIFARNAAHGIAKELGLDYFLELDDDYTEINFRYRFFDEEKSKWLLKTFKIMDMDKVFDLMIDYLEESNALSIAFGQAGDLIGGPDSGTLKNHIKRKVMNSFFCKTDRPFKWQGRMNEDVSGYAYYGNQGEFFLSIFPVSVSQSETQSLKGGLTTMYIENGTYQKSFYSVMIRPACVKIDIMNTSHSRIHHAVVWRNTCPKVLDCYYKKNKETC